MGLLAPLYALAAITILGPILFHLIRRQPQGRLQFSSLMFLRPSPPRLTRKSRLDNLLLLLLRALALLMIALAFSRPYWRHKDLVSQSAPARTIVLLIDTSASMQRTEVWQTAVAEAEKVLSGLSSEDQIALYTIDSELRPIVSLELTADRSSHANSSALVTQALRELKPTWKSGKLSAGLIGLAEQLSVRSLGAESKAVAESQIVLISDFHIESGIEGLQGYAWPKAISVDLRVVGASSPGNARATLMQADDSSPASPAVKIRIENNSHSTQEAMTLVWADNKGSSLGPVTSIQVPAGQVRIVTMPPRPDKAISVRLSGDGWNGDNEVFVPTSTQVMQRIVYVGNRSSKEEEDLSFFLSQAPFSNSLFRREVTFADPSDLRLLADAEDVVSAVIEPSAQLFDQAESIQSLARRGVNVLLVLTERSSADKQLSEFLQKLFSITTKVGQQNSLKITEARSAQHAMISFVDYRSVVFASFADPRFNDFSKIRVWKHRKLELPEWITTSNTADSNSDISTDDEKIEILARLDDHSPWLIKKSIGNGNLWMFTSGWQPSESTFALSSKFIPVMMNLIDPNPRPVGFSRVVDVAEAIEVEDQPPLAITNQMGQSIDAPLQAGRIALDEPGLYSINGTRWKQQFSVQIPINESRLTPLDPAVLLQYGLGTSRFQSEQEIVDRLRQMKIEELEQQQKIWKWLLVVGLGILLFETVLAGLAAKKIT